jgi:hypothetical protein
MHIALYVGSGTVLRAIRAAFVVNGKLQVIETTDYTSLTDGSGLNIYESVEKGISQIHIQPGTAVSNQPLDNSHQQESPDQIVPSPSHHEERLLRVQVRAMKTNRIRHQAIISLHNETLKQQT